jgi:hypothetical protein
VGSIEQTAMMPQFKMMQEENLSYCSMGKNSLEQTVLFAGNSMNHQTLN